VGIVGAGFFRRAMTMTTTTMMTTMMMTPMTAPMTHVGIAGAGAIVIASVY